MNQKVSTRSLQTQRKSPHFTMPAVADNALFKIIKRVTRSVGVVCSLKMKLLILAIEAPQSTKLDRKADDTGQYHTDSNQDGNRG